MPFLKYSKYSPYIRGVCKDDCWVTVSQETDPFLWSALTNENACLDENFEIDNDEEIEGNNAAHEKEFHKSSVPFPSVLQNIDGPELSVDGVVNIAPAEGQITMSFTSEPNWEDLAFPKEYSTGKGHFDDNHEITIIPSK